MSLIKKRFIIHIYLDQLTIYGPICLGKSIEYMLLTTYLCDFCEFLASGLVTVQGTGNVGFMNKIV